MKKPTVTTQRTRRARTETEIELDNQWGLEATRILKSAMSRRGLNTIALAELLTQHGRPTEPQQLRNLLSNGQFKAAWFLDILSLLEVKHIDL